jgi:hypothetical protein
MRESQARSDSHANVRQQVAAEANSALDAHFRRVCNAHERLARKRQQLSALRPLDEGQLRANEDRYAKVLQHLTKRDQVDPPDLHSRFELPGARAAQAASLQSIRDFTWGNVHVPLGDIALDVFGPAYADTWSDGGGAAAHDGSLRVDLFDPNQPGVWVQGGAAIWIPVVPPASPPVMAEVRPYTPFSFRWLTSLNAHSYGGFGIYVLSWDLQGNDKREEQRYEYRVWNDFAYGWDANDHNPSYYVDGPTPVDRPPGTGWDIDYAYPPGKQAPYFGVSGDRIYKAAVWCFGGVWVGNAPAYVISRIAAPVPFVVVGYSPYLTI